MYASDPNTAPVHDARSQSHSLSVPRASPVPPPLAADASPIVPDWQYVSPRSALPSPSLSPSPSPIPFPFPFPGSNQHPNPNPHVAPRAASPQSMVSSGSANSDASGPAVHAGAGKKQGIDRNRKPCGACSSSKRKCKLIPTSPNLCERCRNQGLLECPPHISWTTRKASLCDSGSLSPLDTDEREQLSSRSASPSYSYFGAGAGSSLSTSPVGYAVGGGGGGSGSAGVSSYQNEQGAYASLSTTQEWVQAQTASESGGSSSTAGAYEPFHAPQNPNPNPNPNHNFAVPQYAGQDGQNAAASYGPPALPVCHVCQTPYNEFLMLSYALAALSASSSSSPPSPSLSASLPYELDQAVLNAYGQVPPGHVPVPMHVPAPSDSGASYKTSY